MVQNSDPLDISPSCRSLVDALVGQGSATTIVLAPTSNGKNALVSPTSPSSSTIEARGIEQSCTKTGGWPGLEVETWPSDKHGNPMLFAAQINFAQLAEVRVSSMIPSADSLRLPSTGTLLLFISPDYRSFRDKERGWISLSLCQPSAVQVKLASGSQSPQKVLPEVFLKPDVLPYLTEEGREQFLASVKDTGLSNSDQENVSSWLHEEFAGNHNRIAANHQVLGMTGSKARRAALVSAFHANGISFDEKRMVDSHYQHLVSEASQWIVVCKFCPSLLASFSENRELYICVRAEDFEINNFDRFRAVFL